MAFLISDSFRENLPTAISTLQEQAAAKRQQSYIPLGETATPSSFPSAPTVRAPFTPSNPWEGPSSGGANVLPPSAFASAQPDLTGGFSAVPSFTPPQLRTPFGTLGGGTPYTAPVAPRPPVFDLSFGGSTAALSPFYKSQYAGPAPDAGQAGDIFSQYGGLGNVPEATLNKSAPGLLDPRLWDIRTASESVLGRDIATPIGRAFQDKILPGIPVVGAPLSGLSNLYDVGAEKYGLPTTGDVAAGVFSPGGLALTGGIAAGSAGSIPRAFGREILGDVAGEYAGQALGGQTGIGGAAGAGLLPLIGGAGAASLAEGLVRNAPQALGEAAQSAARNIDVAQPTATRRLLSGAIDPETGRPFDYQRIIGAAEEGGEPAARAAIDAPTGVVNPVKMMDELPAKPTPRTINSLMQEYEGAVGTASLDLRRTLDDGRQLLQQSGVKGAWDGSRFSVKRTPEVEALYKALHGEGPVPAGYEAVYDDLQRLVAQETGATVAADPNFIPRDDYFYRGWKQPRQAQIGGKGQVGVTPGYQKPRVDATFSELLDEGWEPASWNPYEMIALRRRSGVEFRAQQELVERLKETGLAMQADAAPSGWRVPQIGPAFEGKPFSYIPSPKAGDAASRLAAAEELSGAAVGFTPRLAVPNKVADILEGVYGRRPNLGALQPILTAGNRFKQAKLLASLFQQVDFAGRTVGSLTGGAIDELTESVISAAKLNPIDASRHMYQAGRNLIQVPTAPFRLLHANVSPVRRRQILDQILDSTEPLVRDRPGVTIRSIADQGGFADDISIVTRDIVADIRAAAEEGPPSWLRETASQNAVTRTVRQINAASQNGLFDGVYRQAKVVALKNDIVPRLARQHPEWSDKQIAQEAANLVNMRFSTITRSQDIIKNPVIRELSRGLIFSTNESQALIRGALSTVVGGNKRNWANYWAGAFIALAATAEMVHYASTGEHLPLDRLVPVEKNKYSPFGIAYNNQFLAPDLPLKGRNGVRTSLDLVAQLDTIFRVLDPKGFIESRENVIPRSIASQVTGKDFFGESLDSPQERIQQAVSDLVEPIGLSQVRSSLGIGKETEARLGGPAQAFQGTGLNLRAETSPDLRDRMAREFAEKEGLTDIKGWDDLEPAQKKQALQAFPDIADELDTRGDESAARGNEVAQTFERADAIAATFTEAQIKDDQALNSGAMSPADWKENRNDRQFALRQQRDVIFSALPDREARDATERYYEAIDDAVFDKTIANGVDWDKVDAWMAAQSPADQAEIARNTGLGGTEQEKRYRQQTKVIADSGYFDVSDQLAAEMGTVLGLQVSSRAELEEQVRAGLVAELKQQGGSIAEINIILPTIQRSLLSRYYTALGNIHKEIRTTRPDVALALVETGRWEPGKEAAGQLLSATTEEQE